MGDPRLADDAERLSTLVTCFLAEGTGAGIGLLGALRALDLFAVPAGPSPVESVGQQEPTSPAVGS